MDDWSQWSAKSKPIPDCRMAQSDSVRDVAIGRIGIRSFYEIGQSLVIGELRTVVDGATWTLRYKEPPIGSRRPSIERCRRVGRATSSSNRNHFRSTFKRRYLENGEIAIGVKGTLIGNRPRATEWRSQILSVTLYKGRNRFRSTFKPQLLENGKRWSFAFSGANEAHRVSIFCMSQSPSAQ